MRPEVKLTSKVIKSGITCLLVLAALGALVVTGGCASGPRPGPQPMVATNQQVALVQNGTEMVSAVSGNNITKGNQTPAVIYKDRLYFFCCQRHMRDFCANPSQYINKVNLPNGMDIRGLKLPETVAAAPTHSTAPNLNTVQDIAVGASPVRGAEDAPVTIVEFADMQCPYCIREWPKLQQILDEYPEKVRVVFKHYPLSFHKKAKPAHAAMELALREQGGDTFWKMHDLIVANPKNLEPSDLRGYAETLKLDMEVFDAVLADPAKIDELIVPSLVEARKYGVRGTPTIFINGKRMTSRTIDAYKTRIDEILSESDAEG